MNLLWLNTWEFYSGIQEKWCDSAVIVIIVNHRKAEDREQQRDEIVHFSVYLSLHLDETHHHPSSLLTFIFFCLFLFFLTIAMRCTTTSCHILDDAAESETGSW